MMSFSGTARTGEQTQPQQSSELQDWLLLIAQGELILLLRKSKQDAKIRIECADIVHSPDGCTVSPFPFGLWWAGLFIEKDPTWDFASLTIERYAEQFRIGIQEYTSMLGTSDPDLRPFQKAGGKLMTYHGQVSLPSSARIEAEGLTYVLTE
jgi:hypothetical protein